MKAITVFLIAIIALVILTACTRTTEPMPTSAETQDETQNDLTAGLIIEEPQDLGMLDTIEVSDSIPE